MKKGKTQTLRLIFAILGLILIAAFPLVIWDALGNGAQHFMTYGNPGLTGDSSGNSAVKFFFGTFWTDNFNAFGLYSGQWRAVMGIDSKTGTGASDFLAALSLIAVILLIIALAYEIVMFVLRKIKPIKDNKILGEVQKWGYLAQSIIYLFAILIIGIPLLVMASKINIITFRNADFNAYGGIKGIIEVVIATIMLICTLVDFIPLMLKKKEKLTITTNK